MGMRWEGCLCRETRTSPGPGFKQGLPQLLQPACPYLWGTTCTCLCLLWAEHIAREWCLRRGITTFLQQWSSLRPWRTCVDNAWLAAHPNWLLLLHAWDCVFFLLDHQCSLLTCSSSKHTSDLLAKCLIWAGISPEQDQATVPQIGINCFFCL